MKASVPFRLGAAIRKRREHLCISQEQLGERAGLHRTYVGAVERGERNVTVVTALKIASALETTLSTLLVEIESARTISQSKGKHKDG